MDVPNIFQGLIDNLIKAFLHKFKFEINSHIYCVAALFHFSKLSKWQTRSDCSVLRKKALDNITNVAKSFLNKKNKSQENQETIINKTISTTSSFDSINGLIEDDYNLNESEIG